MPASGYYEWLETSGGKQPYYFTRRDGQPLTFAGVWDTWHERRENKTLQSCAVVITEPNKFAAEVHDRMPVILEKFDFDNWLRDSPDEAAALMKPASEDTLQKRAVSKRVNSSKTPKDDPTLVAEIPLAA